MKTDQRPRDVRWQPGKVGARALAKSLVCFGGTMNLRAPLAEDECKARCGHTKHQAGSAIPRVLDDCFRDRAVEVN